MSEIILRPDSKGRLNLGDLAKDVSSYRVIKEECGKLTLIPYSEIPYEDKWIFENKDIIQKIKEEFEKTSKL